MPHDLDAEWRAENPQPTLDDLRITWVGAELIRLEEVPIEALRWFDQAMQKEAGGDAIGLDEIVTAIKLCLHPDSHQAFLERVDHVSIHRLMRLWRKLAELSAGRPTEAASDSGGGSQPNGTSSTGDSPTTVGSTLPPSVIVGSSTPPTPSGSTVESPPS